jgi:sulfatase modifying factor 1
MIAIPRAAFFLDRTPVTVAAVRAAGVTTTAERIGGQVIDLSSGAWRIVDGATYEHPRGPDAEAARDDEPATQISWDDAVALCARRGARLPTEREWEHAARNGRDDRTTYPWGDSALENGRWRTNAWQGAFPSVNTLDDGFLFASPVGSFPPTPIGLVDMVGNVWQWTADRFEPDGDQRAMRGGSYLCDARVCHGYRIEARQGATPDSALMHVGFRCALGTGAESPPP